MSWPYLGGMENLYPYPWPPEPHFNCRCVLIGIGTTPSIWSREDRIRAEVRAATGELPLEWEDAMCMECVQTAWKIIMETEHLVPSPIRESIRGAQLEVLPTSQGVARVQVLLSPEDAVRVMLHAQLLDDLELALSCALRMSIKVVVSFTS